MIKFSAAACLAACLLTFSHSEAHAGISEDLTFCSSLKNSKERLACYDAAARIEKRKSTRSLSHTAVSAPPPSTPPSPKKFHGGYVVGLGGYDFGGDNPGSRAFVAPTLPMMQGALFGGAAGWNFQSEGVLFGIEGRAFYSMSKAERFDSFVGSPISFPSWTGWCQSFGNPFCATNASAPQFPFGLTYREAYALTNRLERTAAFDASARLVA
jgi:hypothetical protein